MADRSYPDQNLTKSLIAVSNVDGITPVSLWADPLTHQLLANTKDDTASNLATRTDSATTTNVTYVGKAAPGSATSATVWQIFKMDETVTNTLTITWAGGSSAFNQVWDNRASLSYS